MQTKINVLETHEIASLLAYFMLGVQRDHHNRNHLRDQLIFMILLDTGIRVGELVQLLTTDIWINRQVVSSLIIRAEIAKTGRERVIPISSRLRVIVETFAEYSPIINLGLKFGFLFAKYAEGKSITTRQAQRIILRAGSETLNRKITPHTLRHTFATRLMRQTNIRVVQELLGHRRLSSTQVYTHPNSADLRLAIDNI